MSAPIHTTLVDLYNWDFPAPRLKRLLSNHGKTQIDYEPLTLWDILVSNGLDDAIWALRTVDCEVESAIYAISCVMPLMPIIDEAPVNLMLKTASIYLTHNTMKGALSGHIQAAKTREPFAHDPEYKKQIYHAAMRIGILSESLLQSRHGQTFINPDANVAMALPDITELCASAQYLFALESQKNRSLPLANAGYLATREHQRISFISAFCGLQAQVKHYPTIKPATTKKQPITTRPVSWGLKT